MAAYNMGYNAGIGGYNTDFWTPEQWKQFGASGGTVDNSGQLLLGDNSLNPLTGTLTSIKPIGLDTGGLFGFSDSQLGTLTNLGGLAMKAMALPSQMDYFKTQTGLAEQQLKSNQQAMADRKTFNQNWANASNSLTGKL